METENHIAYCYKCNTPAEFGPNGKLSRSAECPKCKTALKCCKMCVFFDLSSYNECKEPVAERIVDKEKPNFCDYFVAQSGKRDVLKKDEIFSKADALFKK